MAHKYKYCVMFAYLCTSENNVKFEYVENIACNKTEAIAMTKKLHVTVWRCARIDSD